MIEQLVRTYTTIDSLLSMICYTAVGDSVAILHRATAKARKYSEEIIRVQKKEFDMIYHGMPEISVSYTKGIMHNYKNTKAVCEDIDRIKKRMVEEFGTKIEERSRWNTWVKHWKHIETMFACSGQHFPKVNSIYLRPKVSSPGFEEGTLIHELGHAYIGKQERPGISMGEWVAEATRESEPDTIMERSCIRNMITEGICELYTIQTLRILNEEKAEQYEDELKKIVAQIQQGTNSFRELLHIPILRKEYAVGHKIVDELRTTHGLTLASIYQDIPLPTVSEVEEIMFKSR